MARTARVERTTSESTVVVEIDLDGSGESEISTGVGFYDHMLTALSRHSLIDMRIATTGDLHIDGHHSVEDTAIALGQAIRQALGDKSGIRRFGNATVPLDEALATCVVDVASLRRTPRATSSSATKPGSTPANGAKSAASPPACCQASRSTSH